MKKTQLSMIIVGILTLALMMPIFTSLVESRPAEESTPASVPMHPDDFVVDWWTSPEYPLGANWTTGLGGDIITVYIQFNSSYIDYAELQNAKCTTICTVNPTWEVMTYTGADNIWSCNLPGDWDVGWDVYQYSTNSGEYTAFQIYVENSTSWDYGVYPDEDGDGNYQAYDTWPHIYPAIPPTQINATTQVSKAVLYPGETFDVFGSAHYWPSTSYPGNYSRLIPVTETNVSITLNPTYDGKTDANGDYSFTIQAPTTPGFYNISTDMTNDTKNWAGNESRNVPCVSGDVMIQVLDIDIDVNAVPNATYPDKNISVNGDALWEDASAVATSPVNITIVETGDYWNTNTDAAGLYDQIITVPSTPNTYTVNVEVEDAATGHIKTVHTTIEVQTPTMNLTAESSASTALPDQTLTITGHAEYGNGDNATNAEVNITLNGVADVYWNSTTDANGDYSIDITTPLTPDTYTINITAESPLYTGLMAYNETDILVTAVPVPDLVLANTDIIITAADGLFDGEDIDITVKIKNTGIANATGVLVTFDINDIEIDNKTIDVSQGGSTNITITWEAVQGNNTLNISVDPLNAIEESFENNNNASKILIIDIDTDGDGIGDSSDIDIDGDGYNNTDDEFPLDDDEWLDTDGDSEGDNEDTDDDNDGVLDVDDAFPLDDTEDTDTDGDGVGDNADTDDDDDGVLDVNDSFPLDDTETEDYDGDGIGDNADTDDDEDGYLDATEDPELHDTDNDGLTNDIDNDDDNDGKVDTADTMPYDTDNDGLTNAEDTDDDGDGVLDKDEDLNWNGIVDDDETDWTNSDTDGDGVNDKDDYAPLDPEVMFSTDVEDDSGSIMPFAILGIVLIVVAVVAIMMMGKGKGPNKTGEEAPSETEPEAQKEEIPEQ